MHIRGWEKIGEVNGKKLRSSVLHTVHYSRTTLLTENAQPLLLHELLLDTTRLQSNPAIREKVGVTHRKRQSEHSTVRVNHVHECSIRRTQAFLLRLKVVQRQCRI